MVVTAMRTRPSRRAAGARVDSTMPTSGAASRRAASAWTYSASVTATSGWKPDADALIRGRETVTSVRQ